VKPAEAEAEVTRELAHGERLLWSGIPYQGFLLRKLDAFAIPFSLLWVGVASICDISAILGHIPLFFQLLTTAFAVVGLYMFAGRFFVDLARRGRTAYGLTDQRVIIVSALFRRRVTTLQLRAHHEVHVFERPDGRGTIVFGEPARRRFFRWSLLDPPWAPSFERVDGVRAVHEQLLAARKRRH